MLGFRCIGVGREDPACEPEEAARDEFDDDEIVLLRTAVSEGFVVPDAERDGIPDGMRRSDGVFIDDKDEMDVLPLLGPDQE